MWFNKVLNKVLFFVFTFYLCLTTQAQSTICAPAYNVSCPGFNSSSDPGLTGNMAFPVTENINVLKRAKDIVSYAARWGESFIPTEAKQYHISIYYFPCVSVHYTEPIHKALESFKWDSFAIKLTSTCCGIEEVGWSLLMCVDASSEAKIQNFTRAIRFHINQKLGSDTVPNKDYSQPWHHVTVGFSSPPVQVPNLSDPDVTQPDISLQLDTFYFGTQLYFSREFGKPGGFSNLVFF